MRKRQRPSLVRGNNDQERVSESAVLQYFSAYSVSPVCVCIYASMAGICTGSRFGAGPRWPDGINTTRASLLRTQTRVPHVLCPPMPSSPETIAASTTHVQHMLFASFNPSHAGREVKYLGSDARISPRARAYLWPRSASAPCAARSSHRCHAAEQPATRAALPTPGRPGIAPGL
jgi:hypothetical protein